MNIQYELEHDLNFIFKVLIFESYIQKTPSKYKTKNINAFYI